MSSSSSATRSSSSALAGAFARPFPEDFTSTAPSAAILARSRWARQDLTSPAAFPRGSPSRSPIWRQGTPRSASLIASALVSSGQRACLRCSARPRCGGLFAGSSPARASRSHLVSRFLFGAPHSLWALVGRSPSAHILSTNPTFSCSVYATAGSFPDR